MGPAGSSSDSSWSSGPGRVGSTSRVDRVPDYALELNFDGASDRALRDQWTALQQAGLPSQADHKGMTNAPHLTLVAGRTIPAAVVDLAARETALPADLVVRGLVLFGEGPRVTIAHLIEPDLELATLAARLRSGVPELRYPVWTPHVTLARRVPRARVGDALEVLYGCDPVRSVTATRLRWWDPVQQLIDDVVVVGLSLED